MHWDPALARAVGVPAPYDYGPEAAERYFAEQYLLAAYLLGGGGRMQLRLPNYYVSRHPALLDELRPALRGLDPARVPVIGSSFWFSTAPAAV